jgi:O-antigen/teichoic acid export membrane protein
LLAFKKNIFFNYIGRAYSALIGLFVLPLYLSYLTAEAFGLIGFFMIISGLLAMIEVGLSSLMTRESAKLKSSEKGLLELKSILRAVEFFFLIFSLLIFFSALFSINWIANSWINASEIDFDIVVFSLLIISILTGLKLTVSMYKGLINGYEDQVWLNIFNIWINTMKFVGGLLFVAYFSPNILHYFIYQLFIGLIEILVIINRVYLFFPRGKVWVYPTYSSIQKKIPFISAIAYSSALWIVFTQVDKLLLSYLLTLKEFGYFTLVFVLVNGMAAVISTPISDAIKPRMISLFEKNKINELILIYRSSSRLISVLSFTLFGLVAFYSYEVLYLWSGNEEAAKWGTKILFWYSLGSGMLMLSYFQFYLQFAYGNLKYHVIGSTYFGAIQIIVMIIATIKFHAIGAAIAWFWLQLIFIVVWPTFIHRKFIPGVHKNWIMQDVIPFAVLNLVLLKLSLNIDLSGDTRLEIFFNLTFIAILLLIANLILLMLINTFSKKLRAIK